MQALLCSRTLGGYRALSCVTVFNGLSSPWSVNSKHPSLPAPFPIPEQISRSYRAPEPGQTARHVTLPSVAVHIPSSAIWLTPCQLCGNFYSIAPHPYVLIRNTPPPYLIIAHQIVARRSPKWHLTVELSHFSRSPGLEV